MADWFTRHIVETGRLGLFCFLAAMIIGFGLTRLSVRLIRAGARWWPGNVEAGGLHIHHVVFGVVLLIGGGVAGLVIPDNLQGWTAVAAAILGLGAALVLDEFALILHLRDVYWTETGRSSVDAVFIAIAVTGLLLLGLRPGVLLDIEAVRESGASGGVEIVLWSILVVNLAAVVITLLKSKIWTGLFGLFIWPLPLISALRLGRPHSPWARWFYPEGSRRLRRARWREDRIRRPLIRAKIWVQELIAGRPDRPTA